MVINIPATEAAYSNVRQLTLTGSIMPEQNIYSKFSTLALKSKSLSTALIFCTITNGTTTSLAQLFFKSVFRFFYF
jgi:hypothetical protein